MAAPAGSLHRAVAMSDLADALDGRVQIWAWSLHRTLCDLGYHLPLDRQHMPPLDVDAVLALNAIREQHSGRVSSSTRALALAPVPIIASILGGLPCPLTPRAMPSFSCVRFGYRKCAVLYSFGSGVTSFPLWLASTSGRLCPVRPAFACIAIWAP